MKLQTKTLVKFYSVIVFALLGFAGLVAFWMNAQNTSTPDSGIVEVAKAQNSWEMPNLGCRYRTGGGSCALSEFQSGECDFLGSGQMCYCGNNGTDIQGAGGWTYAEVNKGKTNPGCFANGASVESICQGREGELVTPSSNEITCKNPLRCPPAQTGNLRLEARCVDNGQTINISYQVLNGGNVLRSGTTNATENDLSGTIFDVAFGSDQEARNRYPQFPNISSASGPNGSSFRQGVRPGATVVKEFINCTPTGTSTPTSTPVSTPTATPTTPEAPAACTSLNVGIGQNGNLPATSVAVTSATSNNALTRAPEPGEVVAISSTSSGGQAVLNSYWIRATNSDASNVCSYYIPTVSNGTFTMPDWKQGTLVRDASCAGQPLNFNEGIIIGANYFNGNDVYRPWCVNFGPNTNSGQLVVNGTVTNQACSNICVARGATVRTPQAPNIEIKKTLTSPNFQPIGNTVTFDISVRNTGNVDVRSFTLYDEFDPNYLEFVSSVYRTQVDNTINPDTPTGELLTNGRRRLAWSNMPPRSTQVAGEDGILTVGETFTLKLTFRVLKATTAQIALENDNCGVVQGINYRDDQGQDATYTFNPRRESCAEFQSVTPAALTATITKQVLTPSVRVGNEVKFKAVLTNNDAEKRTYADIDFTDQYDTRYLKPSRIVITAPNGRTVTVNNLPNTGTITISNIQDKTDASGNVLGGLAYGQSYTFELVYVATAPITTTCDTVFANVGDNSNPVNGGTTNQAQACAEITAPPPPDTGANVFLNLLMPLVAIAGSVVTKKYLI